MKSMILSALCGLLTVSVAVAQAPSTPKDMVATYGNLADAILALRQAEKNFVRSVLDGHRHAAVAMMEAKNFEGAAAQIALFANEGDNAFGGVRKRLVEGGHHHNAAGEQKGLYESGFVVVTRAAKQTILEAAAQLQRAKNDSERNAAWNAFLKAADSLH